MSEPAEKATVTVFRGSYDSFAVVLDEHGFSNSRRIQLSEGIQNAGFTIEILLHGGWGAFAIAVLAWLNAKRNRQVNITTRDNEVILLKGYSAEDAAKLLKASKQTMLIEPPEKDET